MDYLEDQETELSLSDPEEEEDEEEEEEEEEEEDDDDDEEEEEEESEGERDIVDGVDVDERSGSRQVLYGNVENDISSILSQNVNVHGLPSDNGNDVTMEVELERSSQRMDIDDSNGGASASLKDDNHGEIREFNRGEIDGLFCPICFEAWSSDGDHHVCCLPCGHIYGLSCIKKWLRRQGSSKCPQCKKKCGIKDIRLLYATRIVAIEGELQKRVRSLEAKCAILEEKEVEWKKREADLRMQVRYLAEEVWAEMEAKLDAKLEVKMQAAMQEFKAEMEAAMQAQMAQLSG